MKTFDPKEKRERYSDANRDQQSFRRSYSRRDDSSSNQEYDTPSEFMKDQRKERHQYSGTESRFGKGSREESGKRRSFNPNFTRDPTASLSAKTAAITIGIRSITIIVGMIVRVVLVGIPAKSMPIMPIVTKRVVKAAEVTTVGRPIAGMIATAKGRIVKSVMIVARSVRMERIVGDVMGSVATITAIVVRAAVMEIVKRVTPIMMLRIIPVSMLRNRPVPSV